MMSFQITISDQSLTPERYTESLTLHASDTLKTLLSLSTQRTLRMPLTSENQQKFAEEIGYRRALMEFASYFQPDEL